MTRRTRRAAASLIALLLVLTPLATALGAHPCPHHDGTAAASRAAVPGHGPDAGSDHEHGGDAGSEAHASCTCVGQCQAGSAPSMPAAAVSADLPAPPAAGTAARSARPLPRVALPPFFLPWGNAPPTA